MKEYYIKIKKEHVPVTEELYKEYMRPDWA